jgi:hypothetical protein
MRYSSYTSQFKNPQNCQANLSAAIVAVNFDKCRSIIAADFPICLLSVWMSLPISKSSKAAQVLRNEYSALFCPSSLFSKPVQLIKRLKVPFKLGGC